MSYFINRIFTPSATENSNTDERRYSKWLTQGPAGDWRLFSKGRSSVVSFFWLATVSGKGRPSMLSQTAITDQMRSLIVVLGQKKRGQLFRLVPKRQDGIIALPKKKKQQRNERLSLQTQPVYIKTAIIRREKKLDSLLGSRFAEAVSCHKASKAYR